MSGYMNLTLHTCPLQNLISQKFNSQYMIWLDLKTHRFKCISNAKPLLSPFNILNIFTNIVLLPVVTFYLVIGHGIIKPGSISMDTVFLTLTGWFRSSLVIATNVVVYQHRFALVAFGSVWYNWARDELRDPAVREQDVKTFGDFFIVLRLGNCGRS